MLNGYSSRPIGSIAKVKGGKRLPPNFGVQDEESIHPYLRVTDFGRDGVDRSNLKFISNEAFEHVKRYIITSDDVYVSIAGTIGRVGIVPDDLSGANLTENAAKITEINDQVDKRYLLYFLRSAMGQGELLNKAGGTSQPKLALFRIEEIEFPCPAITTQRAIADILSTYDDLIENNRRRMALLEDSARQLYREWFVRLRFPGHEHTPIVDGVPLGWVRKTLSEVSNINQRNVANGFDGEIEYIDIASVTRNSVDSTTTYEFRDAPGRARRIVSHGDIIWSCVRPNRRSHAVIWQPAENLIASTGFVVLSPKTLPTSFLYQAVTTDAFVGYLENHAKGAAYPAVVSGDFERAMILVPSSALVTAFDDFAGALLWQTHNLQLQNQKLRQARDLLLPRLMNGELTI